MALNLINVNSQIKQLADTAVVAARDKFGVNLDFTEGSLQQLDTLLQQAYHRYKQSSSSGNPANISIDNTVRIWGSYFGEVIRHSLGGDWIVDQKNVFLQIGSQRLDPLGQVRFRILDGPLYNIQSYFQGLKPGIQNNLGGQPINLGADKTISKKNTRNNHPFTTIASVLGLILLCSLSVVGLWILNRKGVLSLPSPINLLSNILGKTDPVDILTRNGFTQSGVESYYLMEVIPDCPTEVACPAYTNGHMQVTAAFIKDIFFIQIWIEPNSANWEDQLRLVENVLRSMCGNEISNWVDNNIQAAKMNAEIRGMYPNEIIYPNETVGEYTVAENFGYLGSGTPTFSVTILPIIQK